MPGFQLHASVADSVLSDRFIALAPAWSAIAAPIAGALLPWPDVGRASVCRCCYWCGRAHRRLDRCIARRFRPWTLDERGAADGRHGRHPLRRNRSPLLCRGCQKRKVSRLFGRYFSRAFTRGSWRTPSSSARRRAAGDVSPLLRPAQLYQHYRERQSRGPGRAVDRVLHRMVEIVFRNGRTVDRFIGDMVVGCSAPR